MHTFNLQLYYQMIIPQCRCITCSYYCAIYLKTSKKFMSSLSGFLLLFLNKSSEDSCSFFCIYIFLQGDLIWMQQISFLRHFKVLIRLHASQLCYSYVPSTGDDFGLINVSECTVCSTSERLFSNFKSVKLCTWYVHKNCTYMDEYSYIHQNLLVRIAIHICIATVGQQVSIVII